MEDKVGQQQWPTDYDGGDTLGARLLDAVAGIARRLWTSSYTVLTVDLKRASISYEGPPLLRPKQQRSPSPHPRLVSSGHGYLVNQQDAQATSNNSSGGVEATRARARLKVMQVWDLSSKGGDAGSGSGDDASVLLNLGIGGEFELDKGEVKPKLRLRAKHATLHLLPLPALELRHRWPLPRTLHTQLGIDVRCRIPLTSPDKMFDSASSGARLTLNVYNIGGGGIHFTPGGLLFEDNVIELGRFTRMRVAAALEFPRELPWTEEERPFKLEVRRLGIKARTL